MQITLIIVPREIQLIPKRDLRRILKVTNQSFGQNSPIHLNSPPEQHKPTPCLYQLEIHSDPLRVTIIFKQQSRPTFMSEELYNIEQNSENTTDFDHPSYNSSMQNNYSLENDHYRTSYNQNLNNYGDDNPVKFSRRCLGYIS